MQEGDGKRLELEGVGKAKGECVVESWRKCGSEDYVVGGTVRLSNHGEEL